jgi:hypothetical protein
LVVIFAPKGIVGLFSSLAAFIRSRFGTERPEETQEMAEER